MQDRLCRRQVPGAALKPVKSNEQQSLDKPAYLSINKRCYAIVYSLVILPEPLTELVTVGLPR